MLICPLLTVGRSEAAPCIEESCAWWVGRRKGRGSCAVPRAVGYLAGLVSRKKDGDKDEVGSEKGSEEPENGGIETAG